MTLHLENSSLIKARKGHHQRQKPDPAKALLMQRFAIALLSGCAISPQELRGGAAGF
jgi:hypothetical protein